MNDVGKIEMKRWYEQNEVLRSWTTKIFKFFKDLKDIENSNLKEIVTQMLAGKMMGSRTEAFGMLWVSAQRGSNAERKWNINCMVDHLTGLGSAGSNASDESIERT